MHVKPNINIKWTFIAMQIVLIFLYRNKSYHINNIMLHVYRFKLSCLLEKFRTMHHVFTFACNSANYFVLVHWTNFTVRATRIFWRVSKGEKSGQSNVKKVCIKKIQKRKIKRDRKRLNCRVSPGMAWGRMNSGGTQRQAVARA